MKYTDEIEKTLLTTIQHEPEKELILPEWAYRGANQPVIYRGGKTIRLVRHLYENLIGPLDPNQGLAQQPGHNPRNVNPHHWVPTATRHTRLVCPNGHRYTGADMTPDGHRCRQCHDDKLLGTPGTADVNRAKTHCPKNHLLVKRPNGKRRCLECPREQSRAYRAAQKEKK